MHKLWEWDTQHRKKLTVAKHVLSGLRRGDGEQILSTAGVRQCSATTQSWQRGRSLCYANQIQIRDCCRAVRSWHLIFVWMSASVYHKHVSTLFGRLHFSTSSTNRVSFDVCGSTHTFCSLFNNFGSKCSMRALCVKGCITVGDNF